MTFISKTYRLAIASAMIATIADLPAPAQDSGLSAPIEGSWVFSVSGVFTALASFGAGGTWSATGSLDRITPPNSTLFGTWKRVEANRFMLTAYFFSFQDPSGPATVMLKTNQLFRLDGKNGLRGVGDLRLCDLNGQNCGPVIQNLTITGTRIIPEDAGLNLP